MSEGSGFAYFTCAKCGEANIFDLDMLATSHSLNCAVCGCCVKPGLLSIIQSAMQEMQKRRP